jgi:septum formation protein
MTRGFIYLASASPRRRALLEQIDVPFRVLAAEVSEATRAGEAPEDYVERVARDKAGNVWGRVAAESPRAVLAADTVVVIDNRTLGKPADETEALEMLEQLSGRTHRVLTAVALSAPEARESRLSVSKVRFRATTPAERLAYCRTREPYDKAGGYAIQGLGAVFVEHIDGSYSSVMGLPLVETAAMLEPFGFPGWLTAGGLPR